MQVEVEVKQKRARHYFEPPAAADIARAVRIDDFHEAMTRCFVVVVVVVADSRT